MALVASDRDDSVREADVDSAAMAKTIVAAKTVNSTVVTKAMPRAARPIRRDRRPEARCVAHGPENDREYEDMTTYCEDSSKKCNRASALAGARVICGSDDQ